MNKAILETCAELIKNAQNNKLLYEDIIIELEKLDEYQKDDSSIIEVLKYFKDNNITIVMPKEDYDNTEINTDDSLSWYFKQFDSKLLTAEEEYDLGILVKNGDNEARTKLIECNLRLVVPIAKKYLFVNKNFEFMDLVQAGNIGLIKAVDKFDPELGYRFSTFATWWIRQSILRTINNEGRNIRLPIYIIELYSYINRTKHILEKTMTNPTEEDIANYMNEHHFMPADMPKITSTQVKKYIMFNENNTTVSLFTPITEDAENILGDFIQDESQDIEKEVELKDLTTICQNICDKFLSPREADVLKKRFGINTNKPMTLQEIAEQYGITRERIRQVEKRAKLKFKNGYNKLYGPKRYAFIKEKKYELNTLW